MRRIDHPRRALLLACAALVGLSFVACKDSDPLELAIAPAIAGFTAEARPANVTSRYVSLAIESLTENRVVLNVVLSEIDEPVTALAMKLTYPREFSRFVPPCEDGDLFPPGDCIAAEPGTGSGEVFIVRSVQGIQQATEVVGDRVVARVEFLVFGAAEGPIVIEGQNLGGGDASAVLDLTGDPIFVEWFAGTLRGE